MDIVDLKETLIYLQKKIEHLEAEVAGLKIPELMYKRPGKEEHENIADFLNDVEIRLQKLESND